MNLPFLKNKEQEKNFFLALLVKPYKIGAILFEEQEGKLIILSVHEVETENNTEDISSEAFLKTVDEAVSFVEGGLPEGGNVNKTIFSLPYSWIIDSKIKSEYLERLKKLCASLELTPVGYLTSIEAVVHSIEQSEGAPASAIFIEVAKDRVISYLVRAGKIIEVQSGTIEENVIKTCETLFSQFQNSDSLPAKIILQDSEKASDVQQEFLSHKWPKSISFLHVPQVVNLERGFENEATINGVATQMELEVSSDITTTEEVHEEDEPLKEVPSEEFGFVKDGEVAFEEADSQKEPESNIAVPSSANKKEEPDVNYFKDGDVEDGSDMAPQEQSGKKLALPINISGIMSFFSSFRLPVLSKIIPVGGPMKTKLILGVILLLVVIFGFSFLYYNSILGAKITVFADHRAVDKSSPITFSTTGSEENSVLLSTLDEEMSGEETQNATGKKETGDLAHGSITIYNKSEDKKTFNKGVILVGPNNLEFVLSDDVTVASTSAFATSLSSVVGKFNASKFGKEYNLPSNSNFTVKGFASSDFIGKNSDAFSGGTSKTTTVVSKKDLADLLTQATNKLGTDAISKGSSSISQDEEMFPQVLTSEIESKTYTKKEGDEAGSVGVEVKIKYTLGKYKKEDLQGFIEFLSKSEVPGTYVLKEGDLKIDITDIKIGEDGKSATAKLKVNAVYSPKIDTKKLAISLQGKTTRNAEKDLKDITGVTDVVISYQHKLPFFPTLLPSNSKNINVEVND